MTIQLGVKLTTVKMLKKIFKIILISVAVILTSLGILLVILTCAGYMINNTTENIIENEYGVKFNQKGILQSFDVILS